MLSQYVDELQADRVAQRLRYGGQPLSLISIGVGIDEGLATGLSRWALLLRGKLQFGRHRFTYIDVIDGCQGCTNRYPRPALQATQDQKAKDFRALHEGEPFIVPNPWDAGSAKVFAALGFKALASTSAGFAFTLGRLDGGVTLDEVVDHVRVLDQSTRLPVSVDLENGFGPDPADAALAVTRAAEAGAVGGSIEDYDPKGEIYGINRAAERVAAACEAAGRLGFPFLLTGRAENHIRGNPDLDDTIARLQAYERAGADVLYAPGLRSAEEIRAVSEATSKPLNVLAHPRLSMSEIVAAGGQRISVGSGLTWVAVGAMAAAAEQMRDAGDFSSLRTSVRIKEWLDG